MKHVLWILTVLIGTSACGGQPPVPRDTYYRLPDAAAVDCTPALADGPIFVEQLMVDGVHRERALVYSYAADPNEVMQRHYRHWIESPSRLLRDHLVDFLRACGAAPLVSASPQVESAMNIYGKVRRFETVESGSRTSVAVELEFLVERDGRDEPVLVRSYGAVRDAGDPSTGASVKAFGAALSEIYGRLVSDLGA